MSDITLSKAVRSNLLSLQNTADMMATTQNRLATGKKVNSALDNPTNFFTASALNSRASDLNQLMDSVSNAMQTIEAADKGIEAINKLVESAQSTARQALQSSAPTATNTTDLAVGDDVAATHTTTTIADADSFTITDADGNDVTVTYAMPPVIPIITYSTPLKNSRLSCATPA